VFVWVFVVHGACRCVCVVNGAWCLFFMCVCVSVCLRVCVCVFVRTCGVSVSVCVCMCVWCKFVCIFARAGVGVWLCVNVVQIYRFYNDCFKFAFIFQVLHIVQTFKDWNMVLFATKYLYIHIQSIYKNIPSCASMLYWFHRDHFSKVYEG
jgi:hypothetical protein